MKKIFALVLPMLLLAPFSLSLSSNNRAFAFDPTEEICKSAPQSDACNDNTTDNPIVGNNGIATKILQLFAIIIGIASVIVIIIGGLNFVTSGGNPEKASKARSTVLYAVVGLLIALLAQSIVIFVIKKL